MRDDDAVTIPERANIRQRIHIIIFRHDTHAGKLFDVALLALICLSVFAVVLESVDSVRARFGHALLVAEWVFTILFTLEYLLRVIAVRRPFRYVFSFYGVVDLLAVLPSYLSLFLPGAQSLIVIRALRLLRVFRVLKLVEYSGEASYLMHALHASRRKITVFLTSVLLIVLVVGAAMHLIEGPEHGFTNIPVSCYWAIVTLTTVGYGDISPVTPVGRLLASMLMITGYGIIAVPTGIVTAELVSLDRRGPMPQRCPKCGNNDIDRDARFCKLCGTPIERATT